MSNLCHDGEADPGADLVGVVGARAQVEQACQRGRVGHWDLQGDDQYDDLKENDNVDNLFVKELQTIPLILKLSPLPQVQIFNHWPQISIPI